MLTFGRMIRITKPVAWERREIGKGEFSHGFIIEPGTVGLIITNLERIPMTISDLAAIRVTARHNAAVGRPGVIAWIRDKARFIEASDFEYVTASDTQPADAEE